MALPILSACTNTQYGVNDKNLAVAVLFVMILSVQFRLRLTLKLLLSFSFLLVHLVLNRLTGLCSMCSFFFMMLRHIVLLNGALKAPFQSTTNIIILVKKVNFFTSLTISTNSPHSPRTPNQPALQKTHNFPKSENGTCRKRVYR